MPPTNFDDSYEPRLWRCDECRRVLGVVMKSVMPGSVGGGYIKRLYVFWVDRNDDQVPTTVQLRSHKKGMFKVHGVDSCHGVECSHCGALNAWTPSKEAYDRLMARFAQEKVV